jgi:hypothetical protein
VALQLRGGCQILPESQNAPGIHRIIRGLADLLPRGGLFLGVQQARLLLLNGAQSLAKLHHMGNTHSDFLPDHTEDCVPEFVRNTDQICGGGKGLLKADEVDLFLIQRDPGQGFAMAFRLAEQEFLMPSQTRTLLALHTNIAHQSTVKSTQGGAIEELGLLQQFPEGPDTQYSSRYPVCLFVNIHAIMRHSSQPSAHFTLEGVMAIRAPKTRRHLSADALLGLLRTGFTDIADHRPGDPDISLTDALMSAFAMFSLKSPSLLAFDQERTEGNLQRVYGMKRVPCDTSMREILDPVDPESLRLLFKHVFRALQRGKALEDMVFVQGHYLLALDGTGYFSSPQIHCDSC